MDKLYYMNGVCNQIGYSLWDWGSACMIKHGMNYLNCNIFGEEKKHKIIKKRGLNIGN